MNEAHLPPTTPLWATEYTDDCKSKQDADLVFSGCAMQADFLGGRILPPPGVGWWEVGSKPSETWKVQAFFEDCGLENSNHLPDGRRRVIVVGAARQAILGSPEPRVR